MRKIAPWARPAQGIPSNRLRLLLSFFAVSVILACAGCVVLGTVLGTTLSYRAKATEQAAIQAPAEAQSSALPSLVATTIVTGTLTAEQTVPPVAEGTVSQTLELTGTLPSGGTTGIAETVEITVGQSPTLPVEAADLVTPTETGATSFTVQPVEAPGPTQALELTPTSQLTLSSVIFIENVGQFSPEVRFQVRGATGGGVWLASDAIWLTILRSGPRELDATQQVTAPVESQPLQGIRLKFSFVGASPNPEIVPFDRLDTHASYFLGSDPTAWRADVPVWGGVRYREIYPGVDLELSGEGGQYVQRLIIQPGADLGAIRLRVDGAEALQLEPLPATEAEPNGQDTSRETPPSANTAGPQTGLCYLRLTTLLGDLSLPLFRINTSDGSPLPAVAPPSLSDVDGTKVVASPFFTRSIPKAPPNGAQVLPPTAASADKSIHLLYSAFLGRGGNDATYAIAVDATGSAYVTGNTYFAAFPAEPGIFDAASSGDYNSFAVKVGATGSELAYVTFLGGSGDESGYGIAVDRAGSAYLAGKTNSLDLPVITASFDTQRHGGSDGFVIKLNARGTDLDYATFLGGEGDDSVQAITVDQTGNAYVTGATQSANFPATTGALDVEFNGELDAFVTKVNSAGTGLAYSTFLGGKDADKGMAVAVDGAGSAYVTGSTLSFDFATGGALSILHYGDEDAFVVKVNVAGTGLDYATLLGGSRADYGASIAVDESGNAYVTGSTQSPDLATTPWAFDTVFDGGSDAFLAKLNPAGDGFEYAAFLGGAGDDLGQAIAVDRYGYAYVAGSAQSFPLPETIGAFDTSHNGEQDAFVIRVNELGTRLEYATFIGGGGQDQGNAIAVDAMGSVYIAGMSDSPDLAIAPDKWKPGEKGYVPARNPDLADAFVSKLSVGTPFLDLPVSYQTFGLAALGNVGDRGLGRVNSWFDHSYPNHSQNNNLTRWDGTISRFSATSASRIGESWYDGHGGTDFGWDVWNEPVFAAAPGTVIDTVTSCQVGQTSCGNYFGNRVWIDHGNGYASVYAHLKTVEVTKGTVITDPASQPLGIMGNTGRSLGTHLHFGLYYDWNGDGQWTRDETVDPFGWVGSGRDPWSAPSRYLWKYPLFAEQVVGLASIDPAKAKAAVLLSPSGLVTATIPTNALNAPVTVELWDVPPTAEPMAQWHSTGLAFWLMADQQSPTTALLEPVSVRMAYRSKDLVHLDPSRLTLYRWDGSSKTWISLPTTVDANQHQVIVQTAEFGRFDLHAPLLCPSDSIEPDDDHGAALPITTDGIAVSRVFDIKNDVDWFRLEAEAGKIYIVRTGHLGEGVITALQVYDPDSQAPLASGKAANGGGSYLQWRAPFDGSYLIQVRPASGSTYGCQASYEFSVEEVLSPDRVTVTGPAEGRLETSYTFTATISPTAAAQPVTYVWQVDDQAPATHTAGLSDTLTLAWNTAGPHSISVTASNVAGKASSAHSFAVYTRAMAEFTASPLSGTAPLKVSFANTSSGDYTSSTWDLGDGSTSRSKNPTHTYEAPGVYTVTLTVSGPGGTDVKTRAEYISIQPATIPRGIGYHIYLPSIARNR